MRSLKALGAISNSTHSHRHLALFCWVIPLEDGHMAIIDRVSALDTILSCGRILLLLLTVGAGHLAAGDVSDAEHEEEGDEGGVHGRRELGQLVPLLLLGVLPLLLGCYSELLNTLQI